MCTHNTTNNHIMYTSKFQNKSHLITYAHNSPAQKISKKHNPCKQSPFAKKRTKKVIERNQKSKKKTDIEQFPPWLREI